MYGLGLSATEFWAITPRELDEHQALANVVRETVDENMAAILAALHNGPLLRKDQQQWTPAMFMADYVPSIPRFDWKRDLEATQAAMPRQPDAKRKAIEGSIQHRLKRAADAGKNGATAEQVQNIMRGLL